MHHALRSAVHPVSFCFSDPATTEIYTLSLHDALPILTQRDRHRTKHRRQRRHENRTEPVHTGIVNRLNGRLACFDTVTRSEEHTSELQSLAYLVCRLLLEKKNTPRSPSRAAALPDRAL